MSKNLTASDRKSLIRLASSLPAGDDMRRAILAGLSDTHFRAASRWINAAPSAMSLLKELGDLEELSDNLTEMEETVAFNFKLAAADTDITSQLDAVKKAVEGVRKAQAILESAQSILKMYPDDKTAARAVKDADVMVRRFRKHEANARTIVKRLSKKQAPPALTKAAKSLEAALKRLMVDSKALEVIPWSHPGAYAMDTRQHGMRYEVHFRLDGWKPEYGNNQAIVLVQNTASREGVLMSGDNTPFDLKKAKEYVLDRTRNWTGWEGGEDKQKARAQVAQSIARVLKDLVDRAYSWGGGARVEIRNNGLIVEGSYRSDLPKDGASAVGEYRYDQMVDEEIGAWKPKVERALKPYKDKIKSISYTDGDKSWIYTTVTLK